MELVYNTVTKKYHSKDCVFLHNGTVDTHKCEIRNIQRRQIDIKDKHFRCNCLKEMLLKSTVPTLCERVGLEYEYKFGDYYIKSQLSCWIIEEASSGDKINLYHGNLFVFRGHRGSYHFQRSFDSVEKAISYLYKHDLKKFKLSKQHFN